MDDRASPDEALQFDNTFSDAAATAPRRRPAEQTGFGSGVAASAPRHNDSGQLGSRQTPGTTSRAEQPGFDSGVAASAPRHNDGGQTGSRRTPGTTSSSSTRSSKRQRGEPAQCPPGSSLDRSSIYTDSKDPHRGEGKQTGRHYDLPHCRELRMARSNTSADDVGNTIGRGDHDGEEEVA